MRSNRVCCWAMLATLVASSAPAWSAPVPTPNVAPRAATASLKQIDAQRRQLMARMMADPSNLDVAFEYASLSTEAGDLEGAIATLERMLIFAPGLPRLELELGVLYYRLGAYDSALSYFQAAIAGPRIVPPEVRSKVDVYLAAIKNRTKPNSFEGAVTFGARYQTNANGGPDSLTVNLNGFNYILSQNAASTPDVNAFAAGSFRYSKDLASQGDKFIVGLQSYGALYKDQGRLNTGAAELTFGPELNLERFHIDDATLDLYGIVGGVMLGGNPYLLSGGIGASAQKGLAPGVRVGLQGEFREQSFQNSADQPLAANNSGNSVRGIASVSYQVSDVFSIFGAVTSNRSNTEAGYLSFYEMGATVGGTLLFNSPLPQITDPWAFTLAAGFKQRHHDQPDPIVNVSQSEVDNEIDIEGTLSVPLRQGWSMDTTAGYRGVSSNYDLDNTTDFSGSIGFTKRF